MFKKSVFALFVGLAFIYLADVAVFTFRKDSTGIVTVHPYTAVQHKDKREELIFDDPQEETCVNSLLPHQQMSPCWYLRQHPEKRTTL